MLYDGSDVEFDVVEGERGIRAEKVRVREGQDDVVPDDGEWKWKGKRINRLMMRQMTVVLSPQSK